MRRKDREVTERMEMERIISSCQVCHLALSGSDGPYALALSFGYAEGDPPALYFHCAREGRKLDILRANPRAAFIIDRPLGVVTGPVACDWGMRYESVMGTGLLEIVSDPQERRRGLDALMAQHGNRAPAYRPADFDGVLVLKLTVEEMTGKRKE